MKFSETAHKEVDSLLKTSVQMIENAIEALKNSDKEKAIEVVDLHNKLYAQEKKIRKNHIERMRTQECELRAGLYYIDLISHFTRVGDHSRNMVEKILENRV